MSTFIVHTDAGHGWIAVKRKLLLAMGILGHVSAYSYQRGATVYLEEDCDAPLFLQRYQAIYKRSAPLAERFGEIPDRSPIRSYQRFQLTEEEQRHPYVVGSQQAQLQALKDAGRLEIVSIP